MKTGWLCSAHRLGVPLGARRFYKRGCIKCEEKRVAGLVSPDDPEAPETKRERNRNLGGDREAAIARARRRGLLLDRIAAMEGRPAAAAPAAPSATASPPEDSRRKRPRSRPPPPTAPRA